MNSILKSFFPICENCLNPSLSLFCDECLKKLRFQSACALCGRYSLDKKLNYCISCQKNLRPWKSLSISFFYQDGVKFWIRDFKNHSKPERIRELELKMIPELPSVDYIVAVSGDPFSCKKRLYDPAHELAKHMAAILKIPLLPPVFKRRPFLTTQKELDLKTRSRFLSSLVSLNDISVSFHGKRLLLVDDVMTTGASLSVHATLLATITKELHVFCLSRALKTS